jgi:hypothetical protein
MKAQEEDSSMDNSEILQEMANALYTKQSESGPDSLSIKEGDFLKAWWFDAEVNNGGFYQYFLNDYGADAPELIEALTRMKADKAALIARNALNLFGNCGPETNWDYWCDNLEDLLNKYKLELDQLNDQYYTREEDLYSCLLKYMRP